jgi:hypothetical protein
VLALVEEAEALSVYKLMDILATKLRMDGIVSSAGNVVLRLGVKFQIADRAIDDHTWMTSTLAISRLTTYTERKYAWRHLGGFFLRTDVAGGV